MGLLQSLSQCLREERPVALATVVSGPDGLGQKLLVHARGATEGEVIPPELGERVAQDAVELLLAETNAMRQYRLPNGAYQVFIETYPVPPTLIIVGAVQIGQSLCRLAKELSYRVIVTDARAAFATPDRFPEADQVIKGWPQDVLPGLRIDESTYIVLLSHDPKFDEPTLRHVLTQPVRYIGAIGSRRTQQQRFERLRAEGFDEAQLAKIYGPVGLDLGARSTAETGLAILAEITAVRHGRAGGMLRERMREQTAAGV